MTQINVQATTYLRKLSRIQEISDYAALSHRTQLLFPKEADLYYTDCDSVVTLGLGTVPDSQHLDLSTVIQIIDPLNIDFNSTSLLIPRTYSRLLYPHPQLLSVQAIVLSKVVGHGRYAVLEMLEQTHYGKTSYDQMWIEDNSPRDVISEDDVLMIMNRRTGGWDGSREQPVIELLGAGGHVPTVWNAELQSFQQMNPEEALLKEFDEELKYNVKVDNIDVVGGFHNRITNELVVLCLVFVPLQCIPSLQLGASGNFSESTDGIYLGRFTETLLRYAENPEPFAGGKKAKDSNFPSKYKLMTRVYDRIADAVTDAK